MIKFGIDKWAHYTSSTQIQISPSSISRILTDNLEYLNQARKDIVKAGFEVSKYMQMDDTSARVNGQNHYVQILCSEHITAFFTTKQKDRLSILKILFQGSMIHVFNELTFNLLIRMNVPENVISNIRSLVQENMTTNNLEILLSDILNDKYSQAKKQIIEASAIVAYQQLPNAIKILVTDDAPQFKLITETLSLC